MQKTKIKLNRNSLISFACVAVIILLFNLSMNWSAQPGFNWHKAFVAVLSVIAIAASPFLPTIFTALKKLFGREKTEENGLTQEKTDIFAPENIFLVAVLIMGLSTMFILPKTIGYVMDDDTHYIRSVSLVSLFDFVKYDTDTKMSEDYEAMVSFYNNMKPYDREFIRSYEKELSDLFKRENSIYTNIFIHKGPEVQGYKTLLGAYDVAYIPQAFLMILAKGLHLPFAAVYIAGKLATLLTYAAVMYFSIKRLKYGKIMLSILALIPTSVFLASGYGYDHFVYAFLIAGYSVFLSIMQDPEKKFKTKDMVLMYLFFVLSIIPKWLYAFMVLPAFFIPADKFESDKLKKTYRIVIASGAALAIAGCIFFLKKGGLGSGDPRGPEGINPLWQLLYITSEPVNSLGSVVRYYVSCFSTEGLKDIFCRYGYFGTGILEPVIIIMLFILAVFDGNPENETKAKTDVVRWVTVGASVLMGVFICLAFYIIYTPFGADTVYGVQGRYFIPMLFPFLYYAGSNTLKNKITDRVPEKTINMAMVAVMMIIYYINLYVLYLSQFS